MASHGSVTRLLDQLREGSDSAAEALWNRFHHRLARFARQKLEGRACRVADEEDAAVTAFQSFITRIRNGSYSQLSGRNQLWNMLARITFRKVLNQARYDSRWRRGGKGFVVQLNPFTDDLKENLPTPDVHASFRDSLSYLLGQLADDEMRQIAIDKLHGYSNDEIALRMKRSPATVERRLRLIRSKWQSVSVSTLDTDLPTQ